MDTNVEVKMIDVEKVFRDKDEKMARRIPQFFFNYLKRVVHQEELNGALTRFKNLQNLDFITAILDFMGVIITFEGLENITGNGRILLASNHPLGGLDGLALAKVVGQVHENIAIPGNDILMNIPNLASLFIPINKHGSNVQNMGIINDTFASDKTILYFPAGLCSRKQKGVIRDLEWKKTFVTKSRYYKRAIVPVHVTGRNSNWFYNLANWRKRLGIKLNIEMLYLVDEMFKQKDKNIHIIFGKPIPWATFDKRFKDIEWADKIKAHVYQLEHNKSIEFSV
ncbi:MAG: 1-acyl-sn-glycerol-3-phosphate acyltransferase [Bacteroidetes bacterium]|nr:1-acyl-sn-glycerol-3-phosphate acyltransferase [Bacteroidota bacterium]